ncbi:MAG: hypothetical protein QF787_08905 [Nitrospinota bacterium]|jgi:hypothetical protein|nr:hypothetical protein [Nitrospinota bacterium]
MRKLCSFIVIALTVALALPMAYSEAATQIAKKKTVTPPPFFFTQKRDGWGSSIAVSVKRGKKVFRDVGCVGCHPRGRTVGGTAVDVMGNRNPVPIPTLIGAAEHFPRLSPAGQVINLGQMNDLCAAVFTVHPPMDPYSQKYKDLEAYVSSLSPKKYKRMLSWEKKRKALLAKVKPAGGGRSNPCNPCGGNPCAANPCAAKNPCGGNPCAAKNPCGGNPCAAKNPCAGRNPCARK